MRQFHRAILVTLSLVVSPAAFAAASADICYSAPTPVCGAATGVCPNPTSTTLFDCPIAGQKTLPELASDGWSIVQLSGYLYSQSPLLAVQLIVIQRP